MTIWEAQDAREATVVVQAEPPDLIILDCDLEAGNGVGVLPQLRRAAAHVPVLKLSLYTAPDTVQRMLGAGAAGYLTKHSPVQEWQEAVETVAAGQHSVSPNIILP